MSTSTSRIPFESNSNGCMYTKEYVKNDCLIPIAGIEIIKEMRVEGRKVVEDYPGTLPAIESRRIYDDLQTI
jgi:hypothetical protein